MIEMRNSSMQLIHDKTLHTHFEYSINQKKILNSILLTWKDRVTYLLQQIIAKHNFATHIGSETF